MSVMEIKLDNSEKPQAEHTLVDRQLLTLLNRRISDYLFRGKGLVNGEKTWRVVLIDSYRKQRFLEKVKLGSLKFEDFGTILVSGTGDFPQEIVNLSDNASKLISDNLIKLILHKKGYDEAYYVLCDPEKKLQILEATSAEEIQQHGKILYAALDREPMEVISLAILKGIFNNSSPEIDFTVRNRHIEAFWGGNLQKLEEYLNDDANATAVDHNGWNLLHYCALWGGKFPDREDLIFRLAGLKINASAGDNLGRLPRHIGVREGRFDVLYLYAIKGIGSIESDHNGWTNLHYAAWKGNSDCVKLLLPNFIDFDAKDKCLGKTPLHVASEEGHTEIVKVLLRVIENAEEPGSGVFDCDASGRTPLYYAAQAGQVETAKFLIGRKADVEARKVGGFTPLHAAVFTENNAGMIELLISHGSKLESKDDDGLTPLHLAAECGYINNIQVLVEKGADVNAVDNNGKTPLDYAKNHEQVVSYLTEKMASSAGWGCLIA